jgi:hypothetical protein
MDHPSNLSIQDVIKALLDENQILSSSVLFRLSGLEGEELELYAKAWPNVNPQRRKALLDDLNTLSETNYFVDFNPVSNIALDDPIAEVRLAALEVLWNCEDVEFIPAYSHLLASDSDPQVRAKAATRLGQYIYLGEIEEIREIPFKQAESALLQAYHNDTHQLVQRRALEAISFSSHPEVPDMIRAALNAGNDEWLIAALYAMGHSGDQQWEPTILEHLEHTNPEILLEAICAAGELSIEEAINPLLEYLGESDEEIRLEAAWALSEIGGQNVQEALETLLEECEDDEEAAFLEDALENLSLTESIIDFDLFDFDLDQDGEDFSDEWDDE